MAKKMYTPTTKGSFVERLVGALAMSTFSACYFYALLWLPGVREGCACGGRRLRGGGGGGRKKACLFGATTV